MLCVGVTVYLLCVYRYNVVSPADSSWGAELPNGTWTGMIGQVSRKVRMCAGGYPKNIFSTNQTYKFSSF